MPRDQMTARDIRIAYNANCSERPEFYAERGHNKGDLNSNHLQELYNGVYKEIGQEAAKVFVNMVAEMTRQDSMRATSFLLAFYALGDNCWQPIAPTDQVKADVVAIGMLVADAHRESSEAAQAMAAVVFGGVLGTNDYCAAADISGDFLRNHAAEIENCGDDRYRPWLSKEQLRAKEWPGEADDVSFGSSHRSPRYRGR
jgi:hypothetical protein